jgi:hypothetical protein
MPVLRVVSLARIRAHEEVDPLRVDRLVERISEDGIQVNPMMCSEAPSGELVLLDGATRTESLRRLGFEHVVVQIVDPEEVNLETWHHVVRKCTEPEILNDISSVNHLTVVDGSENPSLHMSSGSVYTVIGTGISPNAALTALVHSYSGKRTVSRVTDPRDETVPWKFPTWATVIEFPTLTVEDVMKAAVGDDLLPAGITRFLVPERALRLNLDLDLLRSSGGVEEKQQALESMLAGRAQSGRIRRYEETVVILDD